jgi:hypothetical protein
MSDYSTQQNYDVLPSIESPDSGHDDSELQTPTIIVNDDDGDTDMDSSPPLFSRSASPTSIRGDSSSMDELSESDHETIDTRKYNARDRGPSPEDVPSSSVTHDSMSESPNAAHGYMTHLELPDCETDDDESVPPCRGMSAEDELLSKLSKLNVSTYLTGAKRDRKRRQGSSGVSKPGYRGRPRRSEVEVQWPPRG